MDEDRASMCPSCQTSWYFTWKGVWHFSEQQNMRPTARWALIVVFDERRIYCGWCGKRIAILNACIDKVKSVKVNRFGWRRQRRRSRHSGTRLRPHRPTPSFGYRSHLQSRQCQRQWRGSGAPGQQGEENGAEIGRADEKESKALKTLFSDYLSIIRVYLSSFLPYLLTI